MRLTALLAIALCAACALVVVLAYENRQLLAHQDEAFYRSLKPAAGTWLPQLDQRGIDGARVRLGGDGRAQVLYFFDTGCPICEVSAPAVRQLAATLHTQAGVALVGVGAGDALPRYVARERFAFPVVAHTKRIAQLFGVRQVPLLVAVDHDGRVLYSHVGALASKDDLGTLLTALRATDRHAAAPRPGEQGK